MTGQTDAVEVGVGEGGGSGRFGSGDREDLLSWARQRPDAVVNVIMVGEVGSGDELAAGARSRGAAVCVVDDRAGS